MKQLWIQYTYADPKSASVQQTADSEAEARQDTSPGLEGPWYRYDVREPGSKLVNETGPFVFKAA